MASSLGGARGDSTQEGPGFEEDDASDVDPFNWKEGVDFTVEELGAGCGLVSGQ